MTIQYIDVILICKDLEYDRQNISKWLKPLTTNVPITYKLVS